MRGGQNSLQAQNKSTKSTPHKNTHPPPAIPSHHAASLIQAGKDVMDWALAIDRNRDGLIRIVSARFALMGIAAGGRVAVLPRSVYRAVLLVLRPAEAALRRLIIIAARGMVLSQRPARGAPVGLVPGDGDAALRNPCFALLDPLKDFTPFEPQRSAGTLPRISVPGFFDPVFLTPNIASRDDLLSAAHLCQRLNALHRVLDNLKREARRLARWRARRDVALKSEAPVRRLSTLRPGRPPGSRKRPVHAVDDLLRECHALALDIVSPPRGRSWMFSQP